MIDLVKLVQLGYVKTLLTTLLLLNRWYKRVVNSELSRLYGLRLDHDHAMTVREHRELLGVTEREVAMLRSLVRRLLDERGDTAGLKSLIENLTIEARKR